MRLLDLLYDIGSWSLEAFWLPLLGWTLIALPILLVVRYGESIAPHVRYRAALAAVAALPLGLLGSMVVQLDSPAIRDAAAIIVLPEIHAIAEQGAAVSSLWTAYHTAGLALVAAMFMAAWRLFALCIAAAQLVRYRRAVTANTPAWLAETSDRLRSDLGLRRKVRVAACDSVASPLTFGSQNPLILLPDRLLDSPEDLRLALVHEMIHIRRKDYIIHWLEQIVGAAFYIHPLVALYRREVSVLREITCDTDVLAFTGNRPRYARLLYTYSTPPTPQLDMAVGIVFRQHDLSKRIRSMKELLDFTQLRRSKRIGLLVSCVLLAVAMIAVACSDVLVQPSQRGDQAPVVGREAANAETFVVVEDMPELIGGLASIQQNLVYPDAAKEQGVEGRVIIQFVVDESGSVIEPEIIRGLGSGLDEAALAAVELAKFDPGMQDGKPVKVKMSLPITFKLSSDTKLPPLKSTGGEDGQYVSVDEMPQPIGGLGAIANNLRYPQEAQDAGIEGNVIVQFVVDEEGQVTEPHIVRGLGSGLDEAAIEALKSVNFTPGMQDGKPVKVRMAVPITFKL